MYLLVHYKYMKEMILIDLFIILSHDFRLFLPYTLKGTAIFSIVPYEAVKFTKIKN